ncbi:FIST signal transduction protein [Alteromonas lipolytica]|uniref:Histidine kinase n=1 Tax=Alteromonas lipolytica TaxID=1856405 RepID=A0A1E8FKB8_9ALTE|nr:FIST N-terminal domain-containing protein [Alteromonas lipolytica]OFI36365.1 hypothetical protein BFC17_00350 [Alteromonas lipolytica]GGF70495.1 signaling protein with FIST domain [Alteromonas lipolytica]
MQVSVNRFAIDADGDFAQSFPCDALLSAQINIAFGDVKAVSQLAQSSLSEQNEQSNARWVASSSCLGAMSNLGTDQGESYLHVLSFAGLDGSTGVASAELVQGKQQAIAESTLVNAMRDADRLGEMPSLVWLVVAPGSEEAVLKGLQNVLGDGVPIVGGSSADNSIAGEWLQFDGHQLRSEGIVIAVFYMSEPVSSYFSSGYQTTDCAATVTAVEGRTLYTLDGEPAGEVYNRWLQRYHQPPLTPGNILAASTYFPLGRQRGKEQYTVPLLAHPARLNADNSIDLFATIRLGEQVSLMNGHAENLISRAAEVTDVVLRTHELNYERRPLALLIIFCGGCMLAIKDQLDEIRCSLSARTQGISFIVGFTFGEQGCFADGVSRHGNLMISVTALG